MPSTGMALTYITNTIQAWELIESKDNEKINIELKIYQTKK